MKRSTSTLINVAIYQALPLVFPKISSPSLTQDDPDNITEVTFWDLKKHPPKPKEITNKVILMFKMNGGFFDMNNNLKNYQPESKSPPLVNNSLICEAAKQISQKFPVALVIYKNNR